MIARVVRSVFGLLSGFVFGALLANIEVGYFIPAGWSSQQSQLLEGLLVCIAGVMFGALIAVALTIGERLPVWPIGAYILGVFGFAWSSLGAIEYVPYGEPTLVDWTWLALITLGPALGALIVLLVRLRRSNRRTGAAAQVDQLPEEPIVTA